jgi:hypothetical protein
MKGNEILKTYALFYISENDDFDYAGKLNMLNIVEASNDDEIIEFFLLEDLEFFGEAVHLDKDASIRALRGLVGRTKNTLNSMKVKGGFLTKDLDKKQMLQNKIAKAEEKMRELKGVGKAAKETIKDTATKALHSAGEKVEAAKETVKAVAKTAGDKVGGAVDKAAEFAQGQSGSAAAIAVAAAAALTAGVVAYKRFFSKGARACKNAPDRSQCLKDLKKKAMGARIQAMNAGKAKCAVTKNPEHCKAKIDQKIAAIKTKIAG